MMKSYQKDDYSLSRLLPGQWQEYKSIRLEALQTNPASFGSSYAKELTYSPKEWKAHLENELRAMFALYHLNTIIGITGVAIRKEDNIAAILIASFIQPAQRGKGLSRLFYQARIDWAIEKHCQSVTVSHSAGNESSKAAIKSFGFQYTHTQDTVWPDGRREDELMYILTLDQGT